MESKGRKQTKELCACRTPPRAACAPDAKHKGRLSITLISSDVLEILFSFPQPINYFLLAELSGLSPRRYLILTTIITSGSPLRARERA